MTFRERVLSLPWMILILWTVGFAVYAAHPLSDTDTPWHIAAGLYILKHHAVPTTDPFSWSMAGKSWVTQEWLFEAVLAWLTLHFAFVGAWLCLVGAHTVTLIALYNTGVYASRGNRLIAALLACVATLTCLEFWTVRPQIVSYLMFAVFLWVLQRVREGHFRVLWFVPPLLLVWTNAHGSASIGVLMLLLEVALSFLPDFGRLESVRLKRGAVWRMLLAAGVGFLAGLLNPNGLKAFTYALLSTNSMMTNHIVEWESPNFHSHYFQYIALPLVVVVVFILLAVWREVPLRETAYFLGSFAVTLIHQRFMPYAALSVVPLLAGVLSEFGYQMQRIPLVFQVGCGIISLIAVAGFGRQVAPQLQGPLGEHMSQSAYPVRAVDYMVSHHLTKRVLNLYAYGGYLIYRGIPTFVDGRTDIFLQGSVFSDYLNIQDVAWNVQDLLQEYKFKVAIFPNGYSILSYLSHDPNWEEVYQDNVAEVMVHVGAGP